MKKAAALAALALRRTRLALSASAPARPPITSSTRSPRSRASSTARWPRSVATAERLKKHGIPVFDLNAVGDLPLYVDGADEATKHLHLIKGGGGALTREKIVAACSQNVRVHRRRLQAGGRARQVPAAGRSDPDGALLRRARARQARRPAGAARGLHHRQRQRDPRRAQPQAS